MLVHFDDQGVEVRFTPAAVIHFVQGDDKVIVVVGVDDCDLLIVVPH